MGIKIGDVVVVDFGEGEEKIRLTNNSKEIDLRSTPRVFFSGSPLGKALLNKNEGDEFTFDTPGGERSCRVVKTRDFIEVEESYLDKTSYQSLLEEKDREIDKLKDELEKTQKHLIRLRVVDLPCQDQMIKGFKKLLMNIANVYNEIYISMSDEERKSLNDSGSNDLRTITVKQFVLGRIDSLLERSKVEKIGDDLPRFVWSKPWYLWSHSNSERLDRLSAVCPEEEKEIIQYERNVKWEDWEDGEIIGENDINDPDTWNDSIKDEHRRKILKPMKKRKIQEVTKRHIFRKNVSG